MRLGRFAEGATTKHTLHCSLIVVLIAVRLTATPGTAHDDGT